MKFRKFLVCVFCAFGTISTGWAADLAAGKVKALFVCAECHGPQGISVVSNFPNLAGQKELYLIKQLKAFKSGERKNPEMKFLIRQLSDADIENVAAYFASLDCRPPTQSK